MFTLAVRWGYRLGCAPEHPVKGVARYPEKSSEFFFTRAELGRILTAADADENSAGGLAIRMLALTGARAGEVMGAHWEQFEFLPDGEGSIWTVESSNTKTGRPVTRFLSADLTQRIRKWRPLSLGLQGFAPETPPISAAKCWVFPQQPDPSRPLRRLQHIWSRICRRAGVRAGRIHDLRHTAATLVVTATGSLVAAQAQLGHATLLTTRRYAHLMRESVVEVGATLAQLAAEAEAEAAAESFGTVVPFATALTANPSQ
jgi:integrase